MNLNDEKDIIIDLIENHVECEYLDFKQEPYSGERLVDFLEDVLAFANAECLRDKYIIFGVQDKTKKKVGIQPDGMMDSSKLSKSII